MVVRRGPRVRHVVLSVLLAGAALAVLRERAGAQAGPPAAEVFQALNATPEPYVVAPFPANCVQTYRLFLPEASKHPRPASGYPVLIHLDLSGYFITQDIATIDLDAHPLLCRVLQAGIAVVAARATPSIPAGHPLWAALCADPPMTAAELPGHGMFHPPGLVSPGANLACYDSLAYAMPEKDAVMLVQHVRFHAKQAEVADPQHVLQWLTLLDESNIAVRGNSAGANSLMWGALGPDRRLQAPFAGLTGQHAEDPRPKAAVLGLGCVWWPIFSPDLGGGAEVPFSHFGADTGIPGLSGHSEDSAPHLDDAVIADLIECSALAYDTPVDPPVKVYMSYDTPSVCNTYVPIGGEQPPCGDASAWPLCFGCQGAETEIHPAWNGYAWKHGHPTTTRLVIVDPAALSEKQGEAPVPLLGEDEAPHAGERTEAQIADTVYWLLNQVFLSADAPDPKPATWVTIETGPGPSAGTTASVGVAGFGGDKPVLAAIGQQVAGAHVQLILSGAAPNAASYLFSSSLADYAPFKQGLLVPRSASNQLVLGTGPSGGWILNLTWPGSVPEGAHAYLQVWVVDPLAPAGMSGSNALMTIGR